MSKRIKDDSGRLWCREAATSVLPIGYCMIYSTGRRSAQIDWIEQTIDVSVKSTKDEVLELISRF